MAVPTTPEEFLDLLKQSNLLEEGDVERCRAFAASTASAERLAEELVRAGLLTPFHSTNLLRGRWRGFFLGKYKLLEQLGAGGMGQVYLGTHQMMRRLVALKVLTLRPEADPSILPRFQREARAMAVLDHPNIVHAYDCDQDDKVHYIVLEYVDGISLSALVKKRGPLPVERAVNYIYQAAQGLQHAHENGLVHRDIKPGNMLLDRQGVVKLLDMGLARLFHDHADNLTLEHNAGRALGTADYLAPEQVANSHDVDPRADIYALGASLYYMLIGKAPFQGASVSQKLLLHQLKAPTPLRQLRPEIPEELVAIITRMMAKQPEDRYATAEEVCLALEPLAGPIIPPTELPRPCPAVQQMIQQYMPVPARLMGSGERPLAGQPLSDGELRTSGLRGASPTLRSRTPLPDRPREHLSSLETIRETPLTPPRYTTEPEPTGRAATAAPSVLPRSAAEALFGNWTPELNGKTTPPPPLKPRWRVFLLLAGMLLVGGAGGLAGKRYLEGPITGELGRRVRPLTPTEAANHLDQVRSVELRVRSVGTTRGSPPVIYLNSESDWKTPGNFTVLLNSPAIEQLRQEGIDDPAGHFRDRKIRATGTIHLHKDRTAARLNRLQMEIDDPASVQLVDQ